MTRWHVPRSWCGPTVARSIRWEAALHARWLLSTSSRRACGSRPRSYLARTPCRPADVIVADLGGERISEGRAEREASLLQAAGAKYYALRWLRIRVQTRGFLCVKQARSLKTRVLSGGSVIDRVKCADPASAVGNRVRLELSVATGRFPGGKKGVTVQAPRWRRSANQKHTGP
jgi:hypothetical protein